MTKLTEFTSGSNRVGLDLNLGFEEFFRTASGDDDFEELIKLNENIQRRTTMTVNDDDDHSTQMDAVSNAPSEMQSVANHDVGKYGFKQYRQFRVVTNIEDHYEWKRKLG